MELRNYDCWRWNRSRSHWWTRTYQKEGKDTLEVGHAEKKWSTPLSPHSMFSDTFLVERDPWCREISPGHEKPVALWVHLSGKKCASQDHVRAGGKPCLWYSAERKRSISRVTKVRLWEEKIMRLTFPPRMRPGEKTVWNAGEERRGK